MDTSYENQNNGTDHTKDSRNVKRFEGLEAWKKNHELVVKVYQVTREFSDKDISLAKDLQNSARFITQSIVEGYNRRSPKDKYSYYARARDASFIFQDLLLTARDLNVFTNGYAQYEDLLDTLISGRRVINGLVESFEKRNDQA